MTSVFHVGDAEFRVAPMDPRTQLLVLKRLMRFVPALTASDDVLARLKSGETVQAEDVLGTVTVLAPILASTPDEDIDFVSNACLDVTRQVVDGKGFPVRNPQSGVVSNRDNDGVLRKLTIVGNVLRIVFAPMMAEIAPTISSTAGGAEAA